MGSWESTVTRMTFERYLEIINRRDIIYEMVCIELLINAIYQICCHWMNLESGN